MRREIKRAARLPFVSFNSIGSSITGCIKVVFRKGPLGYLLQDPTEEAGVIKDNPALQDKSAPKKEELSSLLSFYNYACSFNEIQSLFSYVSKNPGAPAASSEGDQLVGFGAHAKSTWQEIWNNRADGYASFILGATCVPGTRMYKLQQYLRNQMQSARPPVVASSAASKPTEMDDDDELESAMLNISPSKLQLRYSLTSALGSSVCSPPPLQQTSTTVSRGPPPQPLDYDYDVREWKCSHQQKIWMKTELESLSLWPGSPPVSNPMKTVSLWRLPPQPELIDTVSDLPSPKYFQLHPFFIWKPENDTLMGRLRNIYALPCIDGCRQTKVTSAGFGRARVIVGITGQYYLFSSRLCCKVCKKRWYADNPQWLEKLPKRFTNLLPAVLTYKKAICKSLLDELRRTGKSPTDMANQVMEMMHLKYERANLAYLLTCQSVLDSVAGTHGQKSITGFIRKETQPAPFGDYDDIDGWNGLCVSAHYLTDCLLHEYQRQKEAITKLLQGTFGQAFRSDHTRKVARKVTFTSGTMSSYAIMNEHWMVVSWVMVQSQTEKSLEPMYQGLAHRYRMGGVEKARYQWVDRSQFDKNIVIKLDLFHCLRRLLRECVSEHHALYSSFAKFLSAAFCVVDLEDMQKLKNAYAFCGIQPANPTKQHIREHCRTKIPQPDEPLKRVEGVMKLFHLASDPNGVPLYKPCMLKTWRIQRVHILRGCISDPEVSGEILYRHGGTIQLNHVQGEGAKVDVWIPIRGTSQQEGYHFNQAQWVTGTRVSSELFQAQSMTGVARWNFQRLVDLKIPGVRLPGVFDPLLIGDLNTASARRFGLEYVEPGCRPVVLDWEKHKSKTTQAFSPADQGSTPTAQSADHPGELDVTSSPQLVSEFAPLHSSLDSAHLELQSEPESTRTLPVPSLSSSLGAHAEPGSNPEALLHNLLTTITMHPAVIHPPAPAQTTPLTPESLEKIVEGIMERQQQQKQQKHNDGSSVHFFYQQGLVRYFYCSTKVFKAYSGEGLTNPRMPFQDFMETKFFQQQKRKRPEVHRAGCLCRFCKMELKQGPNSPHLHTDFPGVAGKYIYCPSKVFSIYQHQGMEKEVTWQEFQKSAFYEMERQRWVAERRK
ncbi:hypothetical protein Q7C36_002885 [Tachysurus vachellii]|uniref:DUF6729 domain-containing protein n=1 Tax=Tachysurus vachellii TaxID=175792 RepID=A0AA88TEM6_TACVA|nr:hypothetical protein Q7C36_002885 [Tachysurus vachellii]